MYAKQVDECKLAKSNTEHQNLTP